MAAGNFGTLLNNTAGNTNNKPQLGHYSWENKWCEAVVERLVFY